MIDPLMTRRAWIACALLAFLLVSCGDEPLMTLPNKEELIGTWECQPLPGRTLQALGKVPSQLRLNRGGSFYAENFPMSEPMRLVEMGGPWVLRDPTRTPSGSYAIELNGNGLFLSIRKRGDQLVLHYPIDVLEGHDAEYIRKK
jgi:hypothetical protein